MSIEYKILHFVFFLEKFTVQWKWFKYSGKIVEGQTSEGIPTIKKNKLFTNSIETLEGFPDSLKDSKMYPIRSGWNVSLIQYSED